MFSIFFVEIVLLKTSHRSSDLTHHWDDGLGRSQAIAYGEALSWGKYVRASDARATHATAVTPTLHGQESSI